MRIKNCSKLISSNFRVRSFMPASADLVAGRKRHIETSVFKAIDQHEKRIAGVVVLVFILAIAVDARQRG